MGDGEVTQKFGGGGVRKKNKEGTKFQRWARRLWKKDILKIMFSKPEHMKWQLNNLRMMKISIICFQSKWISVTLFYGSYEKIPEL